MKFIIEAACYGEPSCINDLAIKFFPKRIVLEFSNVSKNFIPTWFILETTKVLGKAHFLKFWNYPF